MCAPHQTHYNKIYVKMHFSRPFFSVIAHKHKHTFRTHVRQTCRTRCPNIIKRNRCGHARRKGHTRNPPALRPMRVLRAMLMCVGILYILNLYKFERPPLLPPCPVRLPLRPTHVRNVRCGRNPFLTHKSTTFSTHTHTHRASRPGHSVRFQ